MRKIKLKEIIAERGLDFQEVAEHLFPGNKYPRLALIRVASGKAVLDADQISKLALLAGLPIEELYSGGQWKVKSSKGVHVFTNGDYRAELNTCTLVTKIFHKDSLFHESVLFSDAIPLSKYINHLNRLIDENN